MPEASDADKSWLFAPKASRAHNGLAMVFDLQGFSDFFNQADVHEYISVYLNHVFWAVAICIQGGQAYWSGSSDAYRPLNLPRPALKFMGDGALLVWNESEAAGEFDRAEFMFLANRLWTLKSNFAAVNTACLDKVPVADLPPRIRFGLARGSIYELHSAGGRVEHVGFCINLASRLQTYCRELGFIASARIGLQGDALHEHGYCKVIAKCIPGFPKEVVIVDRRELEQLDATVRSHLFDDIAQP
jgi:class 3 adenylate cyclase